MPKFSCPHCSQHIDAPDELAGTDATCPTCGGAVTVPELTSPVLQPVAAAVSQSATVTVTTKNTTSLTMGIIAIVLGVLAMLVAWIPFLGLIAIPVAAIGGLLAFIGLVLAVLKKFSGWSMPLLGAIICALAIAMSMCSTGGTSAVISEAIEETSEAMDSARKEAADTESTEKKDYIDNFIELYDVEAKYRDSILDGKVPGVLFKLKNKGSKTLNRVEVICYFLDADGNRISEEDFYPVLVSGYSFSGDNKPLKPGYVWSMERNKFYAAKSVPSEWDEGAIEIEISDIEFAQE